MISIVVCCGGGFSSSFMAKKVEKEIIDLKKENDFKVTFMPFGSFMKNPEGFDVAMLCPHLRYKAQEWLKDIELDFPVYMIPTQLYGLMTAETIIEDAEDIIEVFKQHHENLAYFAGEGDCTRNMRKVSYRKQKGGINR